MERADKGLAFMLQYENVAWYDSGEVRILDRRVYPRKVVYTSSLLKVSVEKSTPSKQKQELGKVHISVKAPPFASAPTVTSPLVSVLHFTESVPFTVDFSAFGYPRSSEAVVIAYSTACPAKE